MASGTPAPSPSNMSESPQKENAWKLKKKCKFFFFSSFFPLVLVSFQKIHRRSLLPGFTSQQPEIEAPHKEPHNLAPKSLLGRGDEFPNCLLVPEIGQSGPLSLGMP